MAFEDLQTKYDTWKAQHPETTLVPPKRETVYRLQMAFGDVVFPMLSRNMDKAIRLEEMTLAGVPFEEAHRRAMQGVA